MLNIKKIIFSVINRIKLIIFIISLFCMLFLYLKLINIQDLIWISNNIFVSFLVQFLITLSAIFVILFLPTYPIYFYLLKNKQFYFREKLGFTIVSNLSFYIIIGFLGSYLNFPITFEYFFLSLGIVYFLIIIIVVVRYYNQGKGFPFKKVGFFNRYQNPNERFSFLAFFKHYFSLNGILLTILIILICFLFVVDTRFFAGTDVWHHISIIKYITHFKSIPMNQYYGALGLHVFGTMIHFFTGIDLLLLPKYYMFYTIPLTGLVIYNLLRRIFKNKSLANFGIFLLISSFGFSWFMMAQFWPSGIALIQGMIIFFILYVRLKSLVGEKLPEKKDILNNIGFYYPFLIFIFISLIFTHSLLAMIFLLSYFWMLLIYFVKNYRRGFDFLLIVLLLCIFLSFYSLNIGTGYFHVYNPFRILPWHFLLIGTVVAVGLITLILVFYRKSLDFKRGEFRLIVEGRKKKIYKKIEDKFIFPLIFGLAFILIIIFTLFNLTIFKLEISYILYFVDMLVISLFAIWSFATFRYKPKGKPLHIWGLAIDFLLLVFFLYDGLIGITTFFLRVYYMTTIVILIGFVAYIYKSIKINSIQKRKFKIFIISIVVFSIFVSNLYDKTSIDIFNLKERDVASIQWYSNFTSEKQVIISKFGWHAIFIYYDYPFEDYNEELDLDAIHYFLLVEPQYIHPSSHISNGSNILKELKSSYNTDVILILPKYYYSPFSWNFFDQLTNEEIDTYYNLNYLNRIFSAKGENGGNIPYYWVI